MKRGNVIEPDINRFSEHISRDNIPTIRPAQFTQTVKLPESIISISKLKTRDGRKKRSK